MTCGQVTRWPLPLEKHREKLSYDLKVTKMISNARLAQKKTFLDTLLSRIPGTIYALWPLQDHQSSPGVKNSILTITFDLYKLERWIKHHRVCLVTGFRLIYGKVTFWPFVTSYHIRSRGDLWRSNHWHEFWTFHIAKKVLAISYQMCFTRPQYL